MNKISNKKIGIIVATGWSALGFYRGTQHYDYRHTQDIKEYNEKMSKYTKDLENYNTVIIEYPKIHFHKPKEPLNSGQNKFLTSAMAYGLFGSFYYLFPCTGVFYFSKELYRTEIYLRNLEGEKMKRYYNTLDLDCYGRE